MLNDLDDRLQVKIKRKVGTYTNREAGSRPGGAPGTYRIGIWGSPTTSLDRVVKRNMFSPDENITPVIHLVTWSVHLLSFKSDAGSTENGYINRSSFALSWTSLVFSKAIILSHALTEFSRYNNVLWSVNVKVNYIYGTVTVQNGDKCNLVRFHKKMLAHGVEGVISRQRYANTCLESIL